MAVQRDNNGKEWRSTPDGKFWFTDDNRDEFQPWENISHLFAPTETIHSLVDQDGDEWTLLSDGSWLLVGTDLAITLKEASLFWDRSTTKAVVREMHRYRNTPAPTLAVLEAKKLEVVTATPKGASRGTAKR